MKIQDILGGRELFESPQLIEPFKSELDFPDENAKLAKEFMANPNKKLIKNYSDILHLYRVLGSYAIINVENPDHPIIEFRMKYKILNYKFLQRTCAQQVSVWRNPSQLKLKGISYEIFFDYLLKAYNTVICDKAQTPDGQRLWINVIPECFSRGVLVYYVNVSISDPEIIRIKNYNNFNKIKDEKEVWKAGTYISQTRRFIVTTSSINMSILRKTARNTHYEEGDEEGENVPEELE